MNTLGIFLFILLSLIALFILATISISYFLSGPVYQGPISDHFDGKHFFNPHGPQPKGFPDVMKWIFTRKKGPWKKCLHADPFPKPETQIAGCRIYFINHSTFLIQLENLNILTDPVWSYRVSPFKRFGPARMRPPGIALKDLPPIDIILISHNHYDHLDLDTMKLLYRTHQPKVITPLGVKAFLYQHEIFAEEDLDWWEIHIHQHITIQALPAQHFSGRGGFDRDKTLWCGYHIMTSKQSIYFAGDTGYNEITFKEIGVKIPSIDISLIPIGAYKPRWFMSPVHTSPHEAAKIHLDVKSKQSIASHYGTFPLADEGQQELYNDFKVALAEHGIPTLQFIMLEEGQFYEG